MVAQRHFRRRPRQRGRGEYRLLAPAPDRSRETCIVAGIPAMQLLGRDGRLLPTRVQAATASARMPVLVTVRPRGSAIATARFSPDVPGPGEPTLASGNCEPTAYRLRVAALGGGTTTVPVSPPTPVCEHGSLQASAYAG
jgi:hypothetical protein